MYSRRVLVALTMAEPTHGQSNPSYLRPPTGTPPPFTNVGNEPLGNYIANTAFGPYQAGRARKRSSTLGNRQGPWHRATPVPSAGQSGWHTKTFYIPDGMETIVGSNGAPEVILSTP